MATEEDDQHRHLIPATFWMAVDAWLTAMSRRLRYPDQKQAEKAEREAFLKVTDLRERMK